MRPESL